LMLALALFMRIRTLVTNSQSMKLGRYDSNA